VWAVKDGELVRTFKNANGVNDLSWNKGGQLAACYSDGSVYVVDTITGQ
jgi:WD40 repeat protein